MRSGSLFQHTASQHGFTLAELSIVIVLIAILVTLAVPVYSSSGTIARRNTCLYDQRAMESALPYWRYLRAEAGSGDSFVSASCLPGDGEAYIDLNGNVPGDPSRSLAASFKRKGVFDCSANGTGVGQVSGCDYITDGATVACLTDNQIALKSDGTLFLHDRPASVGWDHVQSLRVVNKTPLGSTFGEITDGMLALVQQYYAKNGHYPRSWGDYVFTDLGLNPDDWSKAVDHVYYSPGGDRIKVTPEKGYSFKVLDINGKERVLRSKDQWSLWYDMKTAHWYFKSITSSQQIDISTLNVIAE
jgi:prepilin-type N-terminal cleavage/methylation domain-containing protein